MSINTKPYIFLIISIVINFQITAQTPEDSTRVIIEDHYIEKMNNKIAVDISLNNSFNTFELKKGDLKYIITPNIPANIKFKVNYDFLSLGVQFQTIHEDIALKGKSNSFNIGAGIILKHFFTDINYNKLKGYYIENTKDFVVNWKPSDPYIQFPDLKYTSFSIASGYAFNSKFSIRSLTSQTERQLKSVGSFIPVVYFDYYKTDNTEKSKNIELTLGPGYGHTFVIKEKVYMSLGLSVSLGIINTSSIAQSLNKTITNNQDHFITRSNLKLGLGYNGLKNYYGIYSNISSSQINYEEDSQKSSLSNSRFYFHLFFGKRFKSPNSLKRAMEKINPF